MRGRFARIRKYQASLKIPRLCVKTQLVRKPESGRCMLHGVLMLGERSRGHRLQDALERAPGVWLVGLRRRGF